MILNLISLCLLSCYTSISEQKSKVLNDELVKIAEEVAISKKDVIDKKTKETLDLASIKPEMQTTLFESIIFF